jgi:outer membrane protein, heavy metal efflux system
MIPLRFSAPVLRLSIVLCLYGGAVAGAEEPRSTPYSLPEILDLALERSPALASAAGAVKHSQGQQVAAAAYPNPSILGSVGRGAIRDPSTGVHVTERTVTVEQPLEWTGKRQARQEAAAAGVAGANAGFEETKLNLRTDVKVAFYQLLFSQRDADLAVQNLSMVEEVLRTVKLRVAAGEATSFDTMKANVELQKAQKEAARSRNALVVAKSRLNTLTAGALGKQFSVEGDFHSVKVEFDQDRMVAQAFEQHPGIQRLTKIAEQAERTVRLERESRVPNISVQGSYHREAGDESLTAGLSVPLPLWYRQQGEIEMALGTKHRAEAERIRAKNELEQAITQYTQEVRTAQDQLHVFETGLLKQAEQTLTVARMSFRQGAASLLDVLDAQRVYRQTLLEYAQVRADLSIAFVRLERAVGAPI